MDASATETRRRRGIYAASSFSVLRGGGGSAFGTPRPVRFRPPAACNNSPNTELAASLRDCEGFVHLPGRGKTDSARGTYKLR
jgi:hypothetical protein